MQSPTPQRDLLKVSTRALYDEFLSRGASIKIIYPSTSTLEYIDSSGESQTLRSTFSAKSSAKGSDIARNKLSTSETAKRIGIPIPGHAVCSDISEARLFLERYEKIVLKPIDGSRGNGVSTDIDTIEKLVLAYSHCSELDRGVIAQEHFEGDDVRLLIVGGKFASAVLRKPACVVGDGVSTILQLIIAENNRGHRKVSSMSSFELISITGAQRFLGSKLSDVAKNGEEVTVMGPANVSLGGTVHESTSDVTQPMIKDAEKLAQELQLGICGVDMMWNRKSGRYVLIEANSKPGINMHNSDDWGTRSTAVSKYVDWLIA